MVSPACEVLVEDDTVGAVGGKGSGMAGAVYVGNLELEAELIGGITGPAEAGSKLGPERLGVAAGFLEAIIGTLPEEPGVAGCGMAADERGAYAGGGVYTVAAPAGAPGVIGAAPVDAAGT